MEGGKKQISIVEKMNDGGSGIVAERRDWLQESGY
jgi:hypothetical protein